MINYKFISVIIANSEASGIAIDERKQIVAAIAEKNKYIEQLLPEVEGLENKLKVSSKSDDPSATTQTETNARRRKLCPYCMVRSGGFCEPKSHAFSDDA